MLQLVHFRVSHNFGSQLEMPHSHGLTDAEEEQLHFANVIQTFKSYAKSSVGHVVPVPAVPSN